MRTNGEPSAATADGKINRQADTSRPILVAKQEQTIVLG